ncbi:MAG: EamA/RhaT family transporter, partial [Betaproteobacteria bacterium]|nr:EamA/RhaT family transporter [Betaproteobacteria bacterium]
MPTASGLMLALIGAIAFSGKAIIVKLAYRHGVDAVTLIMYRMVMAFPFFVLLAWWASRQDHARANPLTRRDVGSIFALGFIGYYFSSYLDFLGLQYISASLERLI